ncbi:MAG TPA: DUF3016 domain-containing protein [Burkholderiaceae bacterium]|nr:DUF3016 domain-containing protein [Burkholderiaceae bacterium]
MNAIAPHLHSLSLRRARALAFVATALCSLAAGAATAGGAPVTTERAEVRYSDPAAIARLDLDPTGRRDWLDDLSGYIAKRAARTLPDGRRLLVTITDVRRAGMVEPWRHGGLGNVRIVRDNHPPRIGLSFRLVDAQGAVIKEGTRALTDVAFLSRSIAHRNDELRYEKDLVDSWLREDFGPPRR